MLRTTMSKYIFAFGSLMWKPGFNFEAAYNHAHLKGFRRDFNVRSTVRWGKPKSPGVTLGLQAGDVTVGVLFEIANENFKEVMDYLRKREGAGFRFPTHPVEYEEHGKKKTVKAVVAVYNTKHEGFIGFLSITHRARMALDAEGEAGTSKEYVYSTRQHLIDLGVDDPHVEEFYQEMERIS